MKRTTEGAPHRLLPLLLLACGLIAGTVIGIGWSSTWPTAAVPPELAFARQIADGPDGDYAFFTYRRYLWLVHKPTGKAQFSLLPDSKNSTQPIEPSRVYAVDQELFPLDQVRYQISERNLTNYLWILNPTTGKAMFIRARRDGGFDESPIVDGIRGN